MLKFLRKFLNTLFCFIAFQMSTRAQQWIAIPLDSPTTIDFPVKPLSATVMGLEALTAKDSGMGYMIMKQRIDIDKMLPEYYDTLYQRNLRGMKESTHSNDFSIHYFMLDSIKGMDIIYSAKTGNMNFDVLPRKAAQKVAKVGNISLYSHTRLIFVNKTFYYYAFNSPTKEGLLSPACQKFLESFRIKSWVPLKANYIKPNPLFAPEPKTDSAIVKLLTWFGYLAVIVLAVVIVIAVVRNQTL